MSLRRDPAAWALVLLGGAGLGAAVWMHQREGASAPAPGPQAAVSAPEPAPVPTLTPAAAPAPTSSATPSAAAVRNGSPVQTSWPQPEHQRRRRSGFRGPSTARPDPAARLAQVDKALESKDPAVPLAVIERILEDPNEKDESLRVQLVKKLATLKNEQRALNRLVACATSGLSRGERLAAIDALADPVAPAARPALEELARDSERDPEVRKRARLVLGRTG